MDDLLTTTELARMLRVTVRTINNRRARGELGFREINIGGDGTKRMPRYRKSDVEQYLQTRIER